MESYSYLLLHSNGRIEVCAHDLREFSLEELQQMVGGNIEIVNTRFRSDLVMVVDDEGLLRNKPLNPYATLLYGGVLSGHHIAGDAVLCVRSEFPEPDIYCMSDLAALSVKEIMKGYEWKNLNQIWGIREEDE